MNRLPESFGGHEFVRAEHHSRGDMEGIEGAQSRRHGFMFREVRRRFAWLGPSHDSRGELVIEIGFSGTSVVKGLRQDLKAKKDAGDEFALRIRDQAARRLRRIGIATDRRNQDAGIEIGSDHSSPTATVPPRRSASSAASSSRVRKRPPGAKNSRRAATRRRSNSVCGESLRPRLIASSASSAPGSVSIAEVPGGLL